MRILTNAGANLSAELSAHYDIQLTSTIIVVDGTNHDCRSDISLEQVDDWVATADEHPYALGTSAVPNNVGVSGHVTVENLVTIGGMTGVHQFVRIGKIAMVGGMSRIVRDVPPFMLVEGAEQTVHDINAVGLRRIGVTQESRMALHKACKLLFKSQLGLTNALEIVAREVKSTPEVQDLIKFLERLFEGKNGRGDQR